MKKYFVFLFLIVSSSIFASFVPPPSSFWSTGAFGQTGFEELRVSNIIIGIQPYERIQPQDILIDLKVTTDFQALGSPDHKAVDDYRLAEIAKKEAVEGQYFFIDMLGLEILKKVLSRYPKVESAFIRIQKPAALPKARSGGLVEISLNREQFDRLLKNDDSAVILANIGFNDLFVETTHEQLLENSEQKECFLATVRATIDLQALAKSNNIKSTVNYVEMANMFQQTVNDGKYSHFETLSVNYLKTLYERYPQIEDASILIRKGRALSPSAPFKNISTTELRLIKPQMIEKPVL